MSTFDCCRPFPPLFADLHNTCSHRRPRFNDVNSKIPSRTLKASRQLSNTVRYVAFASELDPSTAGCYGNSAVRDPLPHRHKGDGFFTHLYLLNSTRLIFVTMQMRTEQSKYDIIRCRHTSPRPFFFRKSCRSRVICCVQSARIYDFIMAACTMTPRAGRKKLWPASGVPESIVIQPQPEGRELIIPRFTGIIEQMCSEIGHRTVPAPTVIPQPSPLHPPTPSPDPHGLRCRNSRGGKTEGTLCSAVHEAPQCGRTTQRFSTLERKSTLAFPARKKKS